MTASLFETIPCPLCEQTSFDVIKPAKYSGDVTEQALRQAYSASSSHKLLDQVVKCRSCDMHYVNPRPSGDLIVESYAAAEDPGFVAQNEGRIQAFRKVLSAVLQRNQVRSGTGLRYLDIGCAGGASLEAARSLGFSSPVGVEPSRWMADFGRRTYNVEILDGILQPGMFPPQSFDFITLWDVLEHVPDPRALLELVGQLLKPNGTFILSYPDFKGRVARFLGDRWPYWLSVHILYYDRKTITRQLVAAGFQVDTLMPYWPVLQLGYIADRAAEYIPAFKLLKGLFKAVGADKAFVPFNMGQTIVVAHKCRAQGPLTG